MFIRGSRLRYVSPCLLLWDFMELGFILAITFHKILEHLNFNKPQSARVQIPLEKQRITQILPIVILISIIKDLLLFFFPVCIQKAFDFFLSYFMKTFVGVVIRSKNIFIGTSHHRIKYSRFWVKKKLLSSPMWTVLLPADL